MNKKHNQLSTLTYFWEFVPAAGAMAAAGVLFWESVVYGFKRVFFVWSAAAPTTSDDRLAARQVGAARVERQIDCHKAEQQHTQLHASQRNRRGCNKSNEQTHF